MFHTLVTSPVMISHLVKVITSMRCVVSLFTVFTVQVSGF